MSRQDNLEESYKQILVSNDCFFVEENIKFDAFNNRSIFLIFILLIFTSQVRSLPVSPVNYYHVQSLPSSIDQSTPAIPIDSKRILADVFNDNQRQFKRERYRRLMIDRLFSQFDEDADGQLSKDELYSLSLRLNIFPRYHYYLKKQQRTSQ